MMAPITSSVFALVWLAAGQPASQPTPTTTPAQATPAASANPSAVIYPHPLVTEVLFAVPSADKGDADGDGTRSATGDEFVELVNPHDKAIELEGYVLTDAEPLPKPGEPAPNKDSDNRLRFVFPKLSLPPGGVVVVFNGYESKLKGPVGDTRAAPKTGHVSFENAFVFTMKAETKYAAFSNSGDCVLLVAPDGTKLQCLRWAETEEKLPKETAASVELAPESKGSVQRESPTGAFVAHRTLPAPFGGKLFSPGRFGEPLLKKP
jgi:hypothetical protein